MYATQQDEAAVYQALDAATLAFYEREMRFEDDPRPGGVPPERDDGDKSDDQK